MKIQDLFRFSMLLGSRRTTGESFARQPCKGAEQGDSIGERQRQGYEGSVTSGNSLSTLTVRLFVAGSRSVQAKMKRRLKGMGRFFGYSTMHIGADP